MSNEKSEKAPRKSRGQVKLAVNILGKMIISGQYKQGETLPVEQELASKLDLGRNALREAVKILWSKGLIVTSPRSGTKVRDAGEWNMLDPDVLQWHADPEIATDDFMLDLIELRRIFEPKAAELAAKRATKEDIVELLAAYDQMANSDTRLKRLEANIEFHKAVLKASHNAVLRNFSYVISTYLGAHINHGGRQSEEADRKELELHHQIAWSIASGKAKTAYSKSVELLKMNLSHFDDE